MSIAHHPIPVLLLAVVVLGCAEGCADTVHWTSGEIWNGVTVHAFTIDSGTVQLDISHAGGREWYAGAERALLAGTVPAAERQKAILAVQRWQPGAHRPSIRQGILGAHYRTSEGADGVSAEVWVADRRTESLPEEQVFDVTGTIYDRNGFATSYWFAVCLVSGRLWALNAAAQDLVELARQEPSDLAARAVSGGVSAIGPTRPERPAVDRPAPSGADRLPPVGAAFVGNRDSQTFHRIECASAQRMKEVNKVYFASRGEAEAAGYTPCRTCKP